MLADVALNFSFFYKVSISRFVLFCSCIVFCFVFALFFIVFIVSFSLINLIIYSYVYNSYYQFKPRLVYQTACCLEIYSSRTSEVTGSVANVILSGKIPLSLSL